MDLGFVSAPIGYNNYYYLQLSLKNTGTLPITQIFVSINSVQLSMSFSYLNTTVNANSPLPSYQTATGNQHVTPPINSGGMYSLVIQALVTNGTVYTYQTTITAHL